MSSIQVVDTVDPTLGSEFKMFVHFRSVIQMICYLNTRLISPEFKCYLITRPFDNQTCFNHPSIRLIQYLDIYHSGVQVVTVFFTWWQKRVSFSSKWCFLRLLFSVSVGLFVSVTFVRWHGRLHGRRWSLSKRHDFFVSITYNYFWTLFFEF